MSKKTILIFLIASISGKKKQKQKNKNLLVYKPNLKRTYYIRNIKKYNQKKTKKKLILKIH